MSFTKMKPHKRDKDRERLRKKKKSHVMNDEVNDVPYYNITITQCLFLLCRLLCCVCSVPLESWNITNRRLPSLSLILS